MVTQMLCRKWEHKQVHMPNKAVSLLKSLLDFQNQLMADQGKSADQAADSMNGIVGSFRGVNDYLQTHGFKGALLNVTALSK